MLTSSFLLVFVCLLFGVSSETSKFLESLDNPTIPVENFVNAPCALARLAQNFVGAGRAPAGGRRKMTGVRQNFVGVCQPLPDVEQNLPVVGRTPAGVLGNLARALKPRERRSAVVESWVVVLPARLNHDANLHASIGQWLSYPQDVAEKLFTIRTARRKGK
jgi:hypothetical protein